MKQILIILLLAFSTNAFCQTNKSKLKSGLSITNQWIISSFDEKEDTLFSVSKSSFINIDEKKQKFEGNGACNTISGNVIILKNTIKFKNITVTKKVCENSAQEKKFIATLKMATHFKIVSCELFLYKGKKLIMTLESCR